MLSRPRRQRFLKLATRLIFGYSLSTFANIGQLPERRPLPKPAREHIRQVIATLPADSLLRHQLEEGAHGNGVHYPWMDKMTKAGVKRALVEVEFVWRGRPKEMKAVRRLYFSEYDLGCSQVKDAVRLEQTRSIGLEQDLHQAALQYTKTGEGFWGIHTQDRSRGKQGISILEFLDDEWLPHRPPRFGMFDPKRTPLVHSVVLGDEADVERLLGRGNTGAEERNEALSFALAAGEYPCLVRLLLKAGANVNAQNKDGYAPLMNAVRVAASEPSRIVNVEILLAAGANVNAKDRNGESPLTYAAQSDRDASAVIQVLLNAGAHANSANEYAITALMQAVRRQPVSARRALLRSGANVNAKDSRGNTAMIWAAEAGNTPAVEELLDAQADVNAMNKYGQTALSIAKRAGHTRIVELLKQAGARE